MVEGKIWKREEKPRQLAPLRTQISHGKYGDHEFDTTQSLGSGNIHVEFKDQPHVVFDLGEMVKEAYAILLEEGLVDE